MQTKVDARFGWVIVAAGAVMTCVAMGAVFALPVYLQPMADDTGWSRAGISTAMTICFIVMGVAGFGWGTLSDRLGAKPVVFIGALLLGGGLTLASTAENLLVFQISFGVVAGASLGAFFAPIMATTLGWFNKHRGLAVSLVSIGGGVAPMIVTPFASILIEQFGWRSAMLYIAIGVLAIIVPLSQVLRRPPEAAEETEQTATQSSGQTGAPAGALKSVFKRPEFIVLAATFFLCCAAHSGPIFHTVSYAIICGATPLAAASIYSVEGLAGLFGRVIFGVLGDRLGIKRVIVAGLALQAVGIYVYIYVSGLMHFYMLGTILGLAYGGVMPLYAVLAREYFSPKVMGSVLGAITMTSAIGMAFGPVGGGYLFDMFGTYDLLYISSAAIGLAAVAMALAFPPARTRRDGPMPAPQAA